MLDKCTYSNVFNEDFNYLCHYGVPGMNWYRHRYGKWQEQARYADGKSFSVGQKRDVKQAYRDAQNDYLARRLASRSRTKEINEQDSKDPRVLAAGILTGAATGTAIGIMARNLGLDSALVKYYMAITGLSSNIGMQGTVKNKIRQDRASGYLNRHKRGDKDKYKLTEDVNIRSQLSDTYINAYSEAMNELIARYGR